MTVTTVVIPAVQDASGTTLPARVSIALVDENHQPILGWETGDGRPVYGQLALEIPEEGLEVDLLPQSGVGLPGGAATYYAVSIAPFGRTASLHYVQVPDSETAVSLVSLIGAAALSPADILAGRLLPPGPYREGQVAMVAGGAVTWGPAFLFGTSEQPPAEMQEGDIYFQIIG